jgi:hypothetical protein
MLPAGPVDAYHGWELMFLFNTPPPGLLERAPQLQPTADSFRAAFVALCKHGDPNCSVRTAPVKLCSSPVRNR